MSRTHAASLAAATTAVMGTTINLNPVTEMDDDGRADAVVLDTDTIIMDMETGLRRISHVASRLDAVSNRLFNSFPS